jgi:NAD(P)H dehydrogenase (quinone)
VSYTDVDPKAYTDLLKQFGVPENGIQTISAFAADIKNNQHQKVTGDLETLLGRKPIDFSLALKELYKL